MRIILFLAGIFIGITSVTAQLQALGIQGGLGRADNSYFIKDFKQLDARGVTAFSYGIQSVWKLTPGIWLQVEANADARGNSRIGIKHHLYYISLPVLLRWQFENELDIEPYVNLGTYTGYRWKDDYDHVAFPAGLAIDWAFTEAVQPNRKIDFGGIFDFGLDYPLHQFAILSFNLRAQYGFIGLYHGFERTNVCLLSNIGIRKAI